MHQWTGAVIVLFLLGTTLAACRSSGPARPLDRSSRQQPQLRTNSLEKGIHDRINRERRKNGLSPLVWDDRLASIARNHSADMGQRGYFSHESPEGQDFSFRYREAGFGCRIRAGMVIHLGGENIFQNNRYDTMTTVNGHARYDWNSEEQIAESTVQGWMHSTGHRRNILTPHWQREGIGVYFTPKNKIYITQNFC